MLMSLVGAPPRSRCKETSISKQEWSDGSNPTGSVASSSSLEWSDGGNPTESVGSNSSLE